MDEKHGDEMTATSFQATDDVNCTTLRLFRFPFLANFLFSFPLWLVDQIKRSEKEPPAAEAEPEEGEITSSENGEIDPIDFEYEAISSDEELSLRQKIEALEARNLELEKIASISARAQEPYGKYPSTH